MAAYIPPKGAPANNPAAAADNLGARPINDYDRWFILFILLSFAVHTVFVISVRSVDLSRVKPKTIDEVPQRIARILMDKPKKIEKKKKIASEAGTAAKPKVDKPVEIPAEEAAGSGTGTARGPVTPERRAAQASVSKRASAVEREVRSTGMLALLTGVGPSKFRGRAAADIMGGQSLKGVDLDAALKGVTGVSRAGSEADLEVKLTTRRVVETQEKLSITDMVKDFGRTEMALQKLGDIQVSKPKAVGSVPQSAKREENAIAAFVKKNMRSIEAEYNRLLKINPGLSGKITVRFTIQADGSVTDVEIVESTIADEGLKSKILRVVTNWQFPAIGDTEGTLTVNFPFVFQPN